MVARTVLRGKSRDYSCPCPYNTHGVSCRRNRVFLFLCQLNPSPFCTFFILIPRCLYLSPISHLFVRTPVTRSNQKSLFIVNIQTHHLATTASPQPSRDIHFSTSPSNLQVLFRWSDTYALFQQLTISGRCHGSLHDHCAFGHQGLLRPATARYCLCQKNSLTTHHPP
jgi:hypothetical protein